MQRKPANPIHKIISVITSLIFWGIFIYLIYLGYGYYQVYRMGFQEGVKAGNHFIVLAKARNLRATTFTITLEDFITTRERNMPCRTWKEKLRVHAWESGLHSVVDNFPR